METVGTAVFILYGAFFLIAFVLLIYLIIRRFRIRKKEDFEKRDY